MANPEMKIQCSCPRCGYEFKFNSATQINPDKKQIWRIEAMSARGELVALRFFEGEYEADLFFRAMAEKKYTVHKMPIPWPSDVFSLKGMLERLTQKLTKFFNAGEIDV